LISHMSLSYPTAPIVEVGDKITSAQWNALAAAFNARLRGGVGDPTWRLWWMVHSVVRKFCNNDGDDISPVDDWWHYWSTVDPRRSDVGWNCSNGNNTVNPLTVFNDGEDNYLNVLSESERLTSVSVATSLTNANAWNAAKLQRGAASDDGNGNTPALTAATSHQSIDYMWTIAPYLKTYGGFFANPRQGLECGSCWEDFAADNYWPREFVFSPIISGLTQIVYAPGCPVDGVVPGTNVRDVSETASDYTVTLVDGTQTTLSKSEYVEGPYSSGGRLTWDRSFQLDATLWKFTGEFKGSAAQRAESDYRIGNKAFDFQTFFTRQYSLAPARATTDGGMLHVNYPSASIAGPATNGDAFTFDDGSQVYLGHSGFVIAGYYASATGLTGAAKIQILDSDSNVLSSCVLTPTVTDSLLYFAMTSQVDVQVKLTGDLEAGTVTVELAELADYKPTAADAALVLRLATATDEQDADMDTCGLDYANAHQLGVNFLKYGCVFNTVTGIALVGDLYTNPIYDAFRQMVTDRMRFVHRQYSNAPSILSYAVEDDKTVLRFKRYSHMGANHWDLFRGIAPPANDDGTRTEVASDAVQANVIYEVMGGDGVTYNASTYQDGDFFTGDDGVTEYTAAGGSTVTQGDGIISKAPRAGWTNQWLLFMSTNMAHVSNVNWTPEHYGDLYPFLHNRCLMGEPNYYSATDLHRHFNYNTSNTIAEAPSGYNYVESYYKHLDSAHPEYYDCNSAAPPLFFPSCQIYQPDYEVESATIEGEGYDQIVKLTFAKRFRHTPESNSDTIAESRAGWTLAEGLLLEGGVVPTFRTDENALREYLVWLDSGSGCQMLPGDQSRYNTFPAGETGGSCHPRFYFTKLMPLAYVDVPTDNDVQQSIDSPCIADHLAWGWMILRSMIEGFLDPTVTSSDSCPNNKMIDYQWSTFCSQLNGGDSVISTRVVDDVLTWTAIPGTQYQVQSLNVPWLGGDEFEMPDGSLSWNNVAVVEAGMYALPDPDLSYRVIVLQRKSAWWPMLPASVRPDAAAGYGPIANTKLYAELFNWFARGLNLLTQARIELPWTVEAQLLYRKNFLPVGTQTREGEYAVGEIRAALGAGTDYDAEDEDFPDDEQPWVEWSSGNMATSFASVTFDFNIYSTQGGGVAKYYVEHLVDGNWVKGMVAWGNILKVRSSATQASLEAIPTEWRDLITLGPSLMLGTVTTLSGQAQSAAYPLGTCGPYESTIGYRPRDFTETTIDCEILGADETGTITLRPPEIPAGEIHYQKIPNEGGAEWTQCLESLTAMKDFTLYARHAVVTVPLT
jgi:hypothetical protein